MLIDLNTSSKIIYQEQVHRSRDNFIKWRKSNSELLIQVLNKENVNKKYNIFHVIWGVFR